MILTTSLSNITFCRLRALQCLYHGTKEKLSVVKHIFVFILKQRFLKQVSTNIIDF
jgi:hypothetical protein